MSDFLLISALAELSSGKGFGFNSNFLEANVLNIALLLSGVFYLNMPEGSSPIQFYDPRPWRDTRVMPVKRETENNISSFNFNPSAGDFIMWESWLHHEVIPNKSNDRVTLVFNL